MTLGGYTYQIGDLFTTSTTGVTGRIEKFIPQTRNVTKVMLRLANNQTRFAMVDRKSTRLNSSHSQQSRMPSSA